MFTNCAISHTVLIHSIYIFFFHVLNFGITLIFFIYIFGEDISFISIAFDVFYFKFIHAICLPKGSEWSYTCTNYPWTYMQRRIVTYVSFFLWCIDTGGRPLSLLESFHVLRTAHQWNNSRKYTLHTTKSFTNLTQRTYF